MGCITHSYKETRDIILRQQYVPTLYHDLTNKLDELCSNPLVSQTNGSHFISYESDSIDFNWMVAHAQGHGN